MKGNRLPVRKYYPRRRESIVARADKGDRQTAIFNLWFTRSHHDEAAVPQQPWARLMACN
jgi:hypothetical protein